jgi:hypothetical protein
MKIDLTPEEADALGKLIETAVRAAGAVVLTVPAHYSLVSKLASAAQAEIIKQQKAAKRAGGKPDGHTR